VLPNALELNCKPSSLNKVLTSKAKMNQPMANIHQPVTAYTKHLLAMVNDVFKSMKPGKGVKRGN
jgi:hypothetical protein